MVRRTNLRINLKEMFNLHHALWSLRPPVSAFVLFGVWKWMMAWTEGMSMYKLYTNTYLSCTLNSSLSNSGKKTLQSNSAMTSVRWSRSHHGCSNAFWAQTKKQKTSGLCWHLQRNAWKSYFIGHIYLVMYSGLGLCSRGGWMRKPSERKGRGGLRLALAFLPCRLVSHQQSIWSLSGQQGGALTSGWLQHPNLDTQSGRDQEPSCKRINVQFIETEVTFISCWIFFIASSFRKWDCKSKFKSPSHSSFYSNKLDTS